MSGDVGHKFRLVLLASLALVVVVGLPAPPMVAQEAESNETTDRSPTYSGPHAVPDPPELGEAILEDDLIGPGLLLAGPCPTGRDVTEFVGEGFILKVAGRCRDEAPTAAIQPPVIVYLDFPDGEVRIEARAVSGQERVSFVLAVRGQTDAPGGYQAIMEPGRGVVALSTFGGGQFTDLAQRGDLAGSMAPDGWNSLAIRARGSDLWVLVNDEPVLFASNADYARGAVRIALRRLGNPDDEPESAVVVRNLRVARLAE